MLRLLPALLIVAFVPSLHADEWKEHTSTEGRFKVLMPGKPEYGKDKLQGDTYLHRFTFESEDQNEAFSIMYQDTPGLGLVDAATILDAAKNGGIASVKNGKLVREKKIKLGEHQGLEFEFSADGIDRVTWQVYIVGDRLYQVGVVEIKESLPDESITKFQKSFQVTAE